MSPASKPKRKNGEYRQLLERAALATGPGPCIMAGTTRRPMAWIGKKCMKASRAVWIIGNGDPGDLWVLHTCGQGDQGCIRIGHLYLGTRADNIRDMVADGNALRGERGTATKLSEEQVREILTRRRAGDGVRQIARDYPVSRSQVSRICRGERWAAALSEKEAV